MCSSDLWILESADSLAKQSEQHASAPDRRIEWLFQQTLGREPSPTEQLRATDFISKDLTNAASDPNIPDLKTRWTLLAHNLLICNEAMYVP